MENKENLATEIVAENVEPTTEEIVPQVEQPVKTYTKEEVDQIVGRRIARNTAKIQKEYEKKYGELENVLIAGTGKKDVSEVTDTFRQFYEEKGINIPSQPAYSGRDIEILAKAEADEIIGFGYDEVVQEVDRLAGIGQNMSEREKAVFRQLAEYRQNAERVQELSKIGVTEDVYSSKEFREFSSKFSPNTPVTEIYEIYNKMQPRKEVQPMGSMRGSSSSEGTVKDFYTKEEALKFTTKDFDNNPELFKAVERSMTKWKK